MVCEFVNTEELNKAINSILGITLGVTVISVIRTSEFKQEQGMGSRADYIIIYN
jgi:hypothetical protein